MADEELKSTLILEGDAKGAIKAQDAVRKGFTTLNKEARLLSDIMAKGGKTAEAAAKRSSSQIQQLAQEARKARQEFEKLEKAQGGLARQRLGAVGKSFSAVGSLAGSLGGGGAGSQIASGVGSAVQAAENLGRVLETTGAGFSQLALTGGIAGVAVVATAVALDQFNRTIAEGQTALRGALSAQDAYYALLANGTTEQAAERLAQAQRDLTANKAQLEEIETARKKATQGESAALVVIAQLTGAFGDLDTKTQELKDSIAANEALTGRLTKGLNETAFAAGDARKAVQDAEAALKSERERHAATIAQLEQQEKDLNRAYTEGVKARREAFSQQTARTLEDRKIADARAAEDLDRQLERQEADHQKNMLAIQQRGQQQIADALKALAERETQAAQQIADARTEFQKSELKAIEDFNRERARAEQDFRTAQKRAFEDFRRAQVDAIVENDVLAFLENRQQFKTDKRRAKEDFTTEEGRAQEDFDREREAAKAALEERIAGIQKELEEYRLATAAKIAEIQRQTMEELALAQTAYEERLALDQEERDIKRRRDEEDRALADARRKADAIAIEAAERQRTVDALVRIEQQRTATNAALDQAIAKVGALAAAIARIPTTPGSGGTGSYQPISGTRAYAKGADYITEDQYAFIHQGERILTAAQNRNLMGGIKVNVTPRVTTIGGVEYVPMEDYQRDMKALANAVEVTLATPEHQL